MISKINEEIRAMFLDYSKENGLFIVNNAQTHMSICFNCEKKIDSLVQMIEKSFNISLKNIESKNIANIYYKDTVVVHKQQKYKLKVETFDNFLQKYYYLHISCVLSF